NTTLVLLTISRGRLQRRGPWLAGSLTGAVASEIVTEARNGALSAVGNRTMSANAEGRLTARATARAGTKVGVSDPVIPCGRVIAQRIKGTLGITGFRAREFTSTARFGTSMSACHILGLEKVPRVRLFAG